MNFHFPLMPRLFMAIRMEDRFPLIDILQQTPAIPEGCQWALFLRNHDELTLEMVTEDERDYMYRAYAHDPQARLNLGIRRRLAPLLGNDRKKMELMTGLLFSLPGTPVLYYGDEIGMGDNVYLGDRNGVRTPMQWSTDRNGGFSRANPQRLYLPLIIDPEYHYEAINVETQQNNPHSLLWWTKRLVSLRKRYRAFGRGSLEVLAPDNRKVLALVRRHGEEAILVVANLSRFAQHVTLDLSAFRGRAPLELFGQTSFPPIAETPYALTLAPHTFYWFSLDQRASEAPLATSSQVAELPSLAVAASWESLLAGDRDLLEGILPAVLRSRRWFPARDRVIHAAAIEQAIPIPNGKPAGYIAVVRATYRDGEPESYLLPLTFAAGKEAEHVAGAAALARLRVVTGGKPEEGVLYDALWNDRFARALFRMLARGRRAACDSGEIVATPSAAFRALLGSAGDFLEPVVVKGEQSNTSIVFGDLFIVKLFRRVEEGPHPERELGRWLTEEHEFPNAAPLAATLEYRRDAGRSTTTLAVLHSYIPNEGDAWQYTLDALGRYFEDVLGRGAERPAIGPAPLARLAGEPVPPLADELIGPYLEQAALLGQRTAELHRALAADAADPSFAPEPFTDFYRRGLFQGMVSQVGQTLPLVRRSLERFPEPARSEARRVLELEAEIRKRFQTVRDKRFSALRTRCHGDYHLEQVLYTGKDFVIIDFEGEADRPASVRRLKRSPLSDVAKMLRSFHYAAYAALSGRVATLRPEDFAPMEPWARYWNRWVGAVFLRSYLEHAADAAFLPRDRDELERLLDVYLLDTAIYELRWDLLNRAESSPIAIYGIRELVEAGG
jgi:maltose alpha-D-glucosyltransferase/alpha-amylase